MTKSDISEGKRLCMFCFEELVEGTEQKSVEMFNLRKKIRGTRHPSTLPTMHLSVKYVPCGRIRDWRIQASFKRRGRGDA